MDTGVHYSGGFGSRRWVNGRLSLCRVIDFQVQSGSATLFTVNASHQRRGAIGSHLRVMSAVHWLVCRFFVVCVTVRDSFSEAWRFYN